MTGWRPRLPIRTRRVRPGVEPLELRLNPSGGSNGTGSTLVWDGGGSDNLASDALNWTGDIEPTALDTIVFNGTSSKPATFDAAFTTSVAAVEIDAAFNSTITLAENFTVAGTLTQTGSTINGANNLSVQGDASVSGGADWDGTGTKTVQQPGVLRVGAGGETVGANTTVTVSQIAFTGGGTLTNSGTITLQGNNTSVSAGAGGGTFANIGTFTKAQSQATDVTTVSVPFSNTGTVQVSTGVVSFVAAFTQSAGVMNVQANGGGEIRGVDMTISGGTLQGDGTLRATGNGGTMSWQAAMSGTGNVVVDAGATMYLVGAFTDSGFTITNNSTLEWDAGNITLNNGAVINNQAGATFQVYTHSTMNTTQGGGTFNNYGRFVKRQAAGQQWGSTEIQVPFNSLTAQGQQPSTVDAEFGSIGLRSGGSIQANVVAAQGSQVEFGSLAQIFNLLDGTTFSGAGTVRITFAGALAIANNATITNNGTFQIGGFDIRLPNPFGNGQLSGYGNIINNGTFNWSLGDVTKVSAVKNYGRLNMAGYNANSPLTLNSSRLTNFSGGVITWTGFDIQMTSQADPQQPSEIDNFNLIDIQNDRTLLDDSDHPGLGIVNESGGTMQKSAGNATTTIEVEFTNAGLLAVLGRSMDFTAGIVQNKGTTSISNGTLTASFFQSDGAGSGIDLGDVSGTLNLALSLTIGQDTTLSGLGEIVGSVTNNGTIDLGAQGAAVGDLSIEGDYGQGATGTLVLRLAAGANDLVQISGTADLGGTLSVWDQTGFNPAQGAQFSLLTYSSHSGDFALYDLPIGWTWGGRSAGTQGVTLVVQ